MLTLETQVHVSDSIEDDDDDDFSIQVPYVEGPVPHRSVIKLAVLDVFANFCVTVGFAIVGSGVSGLKRYVGSLKKTLM